MKRYRLSIVAVLGAIALVFGGILPTYAQEDASDEFILEEVTVTAQKRAESQQKVAIQMEVVTGEDLTGTGKDNIDDILRDVSNVMINKNVDGMRITLRGLAEDESSNFDLHTSTPMVAVNIDGAYNSSSASGMNLFDVERVEVLSGPQSTLYGSNSPGGILNVVTASPKTDKFSANASVEFGNYGLLDGQVTVNVPIIQDLLAMRLAGQVYKRDSWITGIDNDQDTKTFRLKTKIEPTDTFDATVTVNYSEATSGGRLGGTVLMFDKPDGVWAQEIGPLQWGPGDPVTDPWTSSTVLPGPPVNETAPNQRNSNRETEGVQAEINWDTALGAVSFVPYWNKSVNSNYRNDVEITGPTGTVYSEQYGENSQEQKGAELRIASPEDFFFKWIVGGTWYDSVQKNFTDDLIYDGNDASNTLNHENKAVYANITYPFTDQFRGTAGYRQSWDDSGMVESPAKVGDGITGQEYTEPDYKVGIEYDMGQDAMLYASWATSYRVNTMADSVEGREVPPERLTAYQVGVKSRFLDNKLQLNASAFFYDYKDKVIHPGQDGRVNTNEIVIEADYPYTDAYGVDHPGSDFNNDGDYDDTNITPDMPEFADLEPWQTSELASIRFLHDPWETQFGSFESYGLDVSVDWVPTSKDRLSFSVSYLQAEWVSAMDSFYWKGYFIANPEAGEEGRTYDGETNTYSPEWSARASYSHRFDLGSFGTLIPVIDAQYSSDYNISMRTEENPWNYQEAYVTANASVTFNHASDRWSLNAYVKNIDEYAAKTFWQKANPGATPELGISDPRTFGAVLSVKF